jgi:hypothetical protein
MDSSLMPAPYSGAATSYWPMTRRLGMEAEPESLQSAFVVALAGAIQRDHSRGSP